MPSLLPFTQPLNSISPYPGLVTDPLKPVCSREEPAAWAWTS